VSEDTEVRVQTLASCRSPEHVTTIHKYPKPESCMRKELRYGAARLGKNGHKYRIALPPGVVVELFMKAELDAFVSSDPLVRVPLETLDDSNPFSWRIGGSRSPSCVRPLRLYCDKNVEFKSFELGLNYTTSMTRYEFQAAWTRGIWWMDDMTARIREYLDGWIEVIMSEKHRQWQISDGRLWPQDTQWNARGWHEMPMVIWIHDAHRRT